MFVVFCVKDICAPLFCAIPTSLCIWVLSLLLGLWWPWSQLFWCFPFCSAPSSLPLQRRAWFHFSYSLSCTFFVAMTVQYSYFKDVWLVRIGGGWVIFFEGKWQSIVRSVPDRPFWVDSVELGPIWDFVLLLLCFDYEQDKSLSSCNLYLSMGKQNKTKQSLGSSIVARVKTTEFRLSTP